MTVPDKVAVPGPRTTGEGSVVPGTGCRETARPTGMVVVVNGAIVVGGGGRAATVALTHPDDTRHTIAMPSPTAT